MERQKDIIYLHIYTISGNTAATLVYIYRDVYRYIASILCTAHIGSKTMETDKVSPMIQCADTPPYLFGVLKIRNFELQQHTYACSVFSSEQAGDKH